MKRHSFGGAGRARTYDDRIMRRQRSVSTLVLLFAMFNLNKILSVKTLKNGCEQNLKRHKKTHFKLKVCMGSFLWRR